MQAVVELQLSRQVRHQMYLVSLIYASEITDQAHQENDVTDIVKKATVRK